jgi:hypothetical protein
MSHHVCPRCQRVSPFDAVYCHFDGALLRPGVPGVGLPVAGQLPQEFVFPSKRRCRTLDDFVQGCQYEWEDARELLRRGDFSRFFTAAGRMDLALAAREAESQADPDLGMATFLRALPTQQVQGPRLDLEPRRVVLGKMRPGESRRVPLRVVNAGKGLLQGRLSVAEGGSWLWIEPADGRMQPAGTEQVRREESSTSGRTDGTDRAGGASDTLHGNLANGAREPGASTRYADGRHCSLKVAREQQVALRVDTRGLPAPQTHSARLVIITNGGVAEVPIRLDLGAVPFSKSPFQGAGTPREMAERMRANPKPAVALLESGEVHAWFTANGWAYPVTGQTAPGIAAVQQFFEGMGLSRPPPLGLSETEIRCACVAPEVQQRQVVLRAATKKWVYAQVDSDVPWIRILTPRVAGPRETAIGFEIDASLMDEGKLYEGRLQITANAGQRLVVRVHAQVRPGCGAGARQHVRASSGSRSRWSLGPFLAVALLALFYRALLAIPGDLVARVLIAPSRPPAAEVENPPAPGSREYAGRWLPPGSAESWARPAAQEAGYLKRFVLCTWWVGPLLGMALLWQRRTRGSDVLAGAVAGVLAGVGGAVTAACVLTLVDSVPREIIGLLARASAAPDRAGPSSPWFWTPLWLGLVAVWWLVVGAAVGLVLQVAGLRGRRAAAALALPLGWLFPGVRPKGGEKGSNQ